MKQERPHIDVACLIDCDRDAIRNLAYIAISRHGNSIHACNFECMECGLTNTFDHVEEYREPHLITCAVCKSKRVIITRARVYV